MRGVFHHTWAWARKLWSEKLWPQPVRSLGEQGEQLAEAYLRKQGMTIVGRRMKGKLGELDLIAVEKKTVVFIEVKTRRSTDAGHPADAVDATKQKRLTRLALGFLKRRGLLGHAARFDVVAVIWPADSTPPRLEHFRGAFFATGHDSLYS